MRFIITEFLCGDHDEWTKSLTMFEEGEECLHCGDILIAPAFGVTMGCLIDFSKGLEGWWVDSECCEDILRDMRAGAQHTYEVSKLEALLIYGRDLIEIYDRVVEKRNKN